MAQKSRSDIQVTLTFPPSAFAEMDAITAFSKERGIPRSVLMRRATMEYIRQERHKQQVLERALAEEAARQQAA